MTLSIQDGLSNVQQEARGLDAKTEKRVLNLLNGGHFPHIHRLLDGTPESLDELAQRVLGVPHSSKPPTPDRVTTLGLSHDGNSKIVPAPLTSMAHPDLLVATQGTSLEEALASCGIPYLVRRNQELSARVVQLDKHQTETQTYLLAVIQVQKTDIALARTNERLQALQKESLKNAKRILVGQLANLADAQETMVNTLKAELQKKTEHIDTQVGYLKDRDAQITRRDIALTVFAVISAVATPIIWAVSARNTRCMIEASAQLAPIVEEPGLFGGYFGGAAETAPSTLSWEECFWGS